MSNPTELPDLDKLAAYATSSKNGDWHATEAMLNMLDEDDVLALVAAARRAQPEGEAPQAEPLNGRITGAHACFSEAMPPGSLTSIGHAHVYKALQAAIAHYVAHQPAAQHAESGALASGSDWNGVIDLIADELEAKSNLNEISQFTALCEEFDRRGAALAAQSQGAQVYQVFSQDSGEWYEVPQSQYERANPAFRRVIAAQQAAAPGALKPELMRQAVASVVSRAGNDLRIAWIRPERCDVGTLLYCAVEQSTPSAPGTSEAPILQKDCILCDGTGYVRDDSEEECSKCKGKGYTVSAPPEDGSDKKRIDWLIKNHRWSIRWRIHTKRQIEQWQMVDDGEPWGQWGSYRLVLDTAMRAAQLDGGQEGSESNG